MKSLNDLLEKLCRTVIGYWDSRVRRGIAAALACVVVFVTTYSLILPAITLEENAADEMAGVYLEDDERILEERFAEDSVGVPLVESPAVGGNVLVNGSLEADIDDIILFEDSADLIEDVSSNDFMTDMTVEDAALFDDNSRENEGVPDDLADADEWIEVDGSTDTTVMVTALKGYAPGMEAVFTLPFDIPDTTNFEFEEIAGTGKYGAYFDSYYYGAKQEVENQINSGDLPDTSEYWQVVDARFWSVTLDADADNVGVELAFEPALTTADKKAAVIDWSEEKSGDESISGYPAWHVYEENPLLSAGQYFAFSNENGEIRKVAFTTNALKSGHADFGVVILEREEPVEAAAEEEIEISTDSEAETESQIESETLVPEEGVETDAVEEPETEMDAEAAEDTNELLTEADTEEAETESVTEEADTEESDIETKAGTEAESETESEMETESEEANVSDSSITPAAGSQTITIPGTAYKLRVSYGEDAGIPADAKITAAPVDNDRYGTQAVEMVDSVGEDGTAALLSLFDLTFHYDGQVIAPTGTVNISVVFDDELPANEKIYAVHFPGTGEQPKSERTVQGDPAEQRNAEQNDAVMADASPADEPAPQTLDVENVLSPVRRSVKKTPASAMLTRSAAFVPTAADTTSASPELIETSITDDTAAFTLNSLSYIAIVSYTVDFYYGNYEWHIDGGSEIRLSELFAALGIEKDAKDAVSVDFTNDELIEITEVLDEESGTRADWLLTSLQAFDTEEVLTVKMADGGVIEIRVEDAQIIFVVSPEEAGTISGKTDFKTNNNTNNGKITAKANSGYTFQNWMIDGQKVTNNNNITTAEDGSKSEIKAGGVTFSNSTSNHILTAVFKKTASTITFKATAGGTVTGGDVEYSSNDLDAINKTVVAVPDNDYQFVHWLGKNNRIYSTDPDFQITGPISEDLEFTAVFEPRTEVTIYYITDDTRRGTVSSKSEIANIAAGAAGSTASSKAGYAFIGWFDQNNVLVCETETFVPTGNLLSNGAIYNAVFEPEADSYLVFSVNDSSYGSVAVKPNGGVESAEVSMAIKEDGTKPGTIIAKANEGYIFDHWELNGVALSLSATIASNTILDGVNEGINQLQAVFVLDDTFDDHSYFEKYYYSVNPTGAGNTVQLTNSWGTTNNGSGENVESVTNANNGNSYYYVKANAANGYRFVNWTNNGKVYSTNQLIQPKGSERLDSSTAGYHSSDTFVANFVQNGFYQILFEAGEGGKVIGADRAFQSTYDDIVDINNGVTAVAKDGYRFVEWTYNNGEFYSYEPHIRIYTDKLSGDTVFHAVFEEVTDVNIYYNTNELRGTISRQSEVANLKTGATGCVATPYDGFRFIGWVDAEGKQVWLWNEFVPNGTCLYEGAAYTAVFEPDTYDNYLAVGPDYPEHGYIVSSTYRNTVNDRVVSMYVRENGKTPADMTAVAYEDYVFDHWELNGTVLEGVGETIPANYDVSAYLWPEEYYEMTHGVNALQAVYKDNPNKVTHHIYYVADPSNGGSVSNALDSWEGSKSGDILGSTATANTGYEFAGWVEKTDDPNIILPAANSSTSTFKPTGDQLKDTTYYAMFRKKTGTSGIVGYNMNIKNVPVSWPGPKDFVMTSAVGAVMYYDTNGGKYYDTDASFYLSSQEPSAEGYKFLGWFDKDRPRYYNDSYTYPAGHEYEGELYNHAKLIQSSEAAATQRTFAFNGQGGGRYTVEAVWVGIDAESKRLPYDGGDHYLTAEAFLEKGTLYDTPRYKKELERILAQDGYTLDETIHYQLIEENGVPVTGAPVTTEFKRKEPGVYKVRATAAGTFLGTDYTLEKDIYLIIYPADVIINKVWEDDNNITGNRPEYDGQMPTSEAALYALRNGMPDHYNLKVHFDKQWTQRVGSTVTNGSETDMSAEFAAGPGRYNVEEPEWTDNGDSTWTKVYDDILVRPTGIDEDDQDSYYYQYYADEYVPIGYEKVGEPERYVTNENLMTTITITNRIKKTTVSFKKVDDHGNDVSGAVFSLQMEKNMYGETPLEPDKLKYTFTLGEYSAELANGYYKLEETSAPNGYNILEQPVYFKVFEGDVSWGIWKTETVETTHETTTVWTTVPAPVGYSLNKSASGEDAPTNMQIVNTKQANISIKKVSKGDDNNQLSGAVFQLLFEKDGANTAVDISYEEEVNGKTVKPFANVKGLETIVSDEDSAVTWKGAFKTDGTTHKIQNLPDGKYTMKEVQIPDGYGKEFGDITFTVKNGIISDFQCANDSTSNPNVSMTKEDGTAYTNTELSGEIGLVTVQNTLSVRLPETGGSGTRSLYILGSVLTLFGGLLLMRKRKTDKVC